MSIPIHLDNFDGPLDLLLHLIKTNEMDIADIQVGKITEQYLSVIEHMQQLNLDVAGEFLLMAASLIHLKSRMLLPVTQEVENDDESLDPRAELVRRLLEYQRYKDAASCFSQLACLQQDVFVRQFVEPLSGNEEKVSGDIGVYQLTSAFHQLLKQTREEVVHEVSREQLLVADYIQLIIVRLSGGKRCLFNDFFAIESTRQELVVTFLAMLELVKTGMLKIDQAQEFQPIWLGLISSDKASSPPILKEGGYDYG